MDLAYINDFSARLGLPFEPELVPKHVAIVMDGNGRWAKQRGQERNFGHRRGVEALENVVIGCRKLGVRYLTVYAFSTENWTRSEEEVSALMGLLREYIDDYIKDNENSNIKIDAIGDLSRLDLELQSKIKKLEEISSHKKGLNLHIGLNYGGRDEIIRAIKKLCIDVGKGSVSENEIDEKLFSSYLDTKDIPDPELVIRTSGEQRLSNFLPWQSVYSEFYFTDKLWPDFDIKELAKAVEQFKNRERRFGGR